jgi:hypothetical protein
MITFKQFLESFKMEDQTFSDNNGTYSVPKIVHYATENKKIKEIPMSKLLHNLEPSPHESGSELPNHPEFIERANQTDLKYPIIIVKYPDGLFIADGVHRLYKAHSQNQQTMKSYVLNQNELEQFKIE